MAAAAGFIAGLGMDIAGTVMGAKEQGRVAKILRNLPLFERVDPAKEQAAAVADNRAAMPGAAKLGKEVNKYTLDELLSGMRRLIPNYDQIASSTSNNIASQLRGELPTDVQNSVLRSTAAKALAGGYKGSGMAANLGLRDLGLKSLQVAQQGLENSMRWLGMNAALAPRFDVTSMFLSPQQRIATQMQNNQMTYQSAMNAALGKTAPGETAAAGEALKKYGGMLMGMSSMGMMGGGGMFGGGGGTPTAAGAASNFQSSGANMAMFSGLGRLG